MHGLRHPLSVRTILSDERACRAELAYVIHRKLRAPGALGVTRWTVPMLYSFHHTFAEDSWWKHFPTRKIPGPNALRLHGRGGDESTVNMRAFLASEDHRLVYNDELRGICNEYVQEAHWQLRISSPGFIARHKALVMADPDCGSGPAHVDGVAGGLLIIFLNCCAPLTAVGGGEM
eukprot:jgi/Tetstr1/460321/TSEL_005621.t1